MSAYIIAIGGTGAKFVEAVTHLAATGLFSKDNTIENLHILFVDSDGGNGNLAAADGTIKIYQNCLKAVGKDKAIPWMQSEIQQPQGGLWSPSKDRLRDVFKYDDYTENNPVRSLIDVLYTPKERDEPLIEGFKGRPAIGAAIMSRLSSDQQNRESWETLLKLIEEDHNGGKSPKIFLCGSIFGGTGASGFATLGSLIGDELSPKAEVRKPEGKPEGEEEGRNLLKQVKLGGLLVLPYFQFSAPKNSSDKEIFARSDEFMLKTEAALRYYEAQKLKFDTVYLLGTPKLTSVDNFSTGGSDQRNPPHFLELYAALALRDFLFTSKSDRQQTIVANISRHKFDSVTWEDIPERSEVRFKLENAVRFAFAWIWVIAPDLGYAIESKKQNQVVWSLRFFNRQELDDANEQDKLSQIKKWCEDYLKWLGVLHLSVEGVELLNTDIFLEQQNGELKKYTREMRQQFPNLVKAGRRVEINTILGNLDTKGLATPNRGTAGLAKALYRTICQSH